MKKSSNVLKLAETALFAALCFISFQFKIDIEIPGAGATAFHVSNSFCVLGALFLGGLYGGLAGAIGLSFADLLDPRYITSVPKTFLLKFCICLIVGFVAHKIGNISKHNDKKYWLRFALLSSIAGLTFNVIFDPIVGYFYKTYVLGVNQELSSILAKWSTATTFVNAVISVFLSTILYMTLRPILSKTSLLPEIKSKVKRTI